MANVNIININIIFKELKEGKFDIFVNMEQSIHIKSDRNMKNRPNFSIR